MAITLGDLNERLREIDADLTAYDYGHARNRLLSLINIIENHGIIIHATATVESKKVDGNEEINN